jgi:hypothetical protein
MYTLFSLSVFALSGIVSHRCYFIYGEHHDTSPRIAQVYFIALVSLYLVCRDLSSEDDSPLAATALRAGSYFVSLFSSIAVYRLFFHPIRAIPGPFWARLSKLYHVFNATAKQYLWLEKLHHRYGDFVRMCEPLRS